jgi:carbon storage regulator CsrA
MAGQALIFTPADGLPAVAWSRIVKAVRRFFHSMKGFHMLVLARNFGQEVIVTIGEHKMVIKVIEMTGKQVKLGFASSREVRIDRKEIHDAIMKTGFNPEAKLVKPAVIRIDERLPGELMRRKPE